MYTYKHAHTHTHLLPDLGVKRWKDECKSGKSEKLTGTYLSEVKLIFNKEIEGKGESIGQFSMRNSGWIRK